MTVKVLYNWPLSEAPIGIPLYVKAPSPEQNFNRDHRSSFLLDH